MNNHLSFGAVFDRTVDIYKSHFKTLVTAAFAVFLFIFVMTVVLLLAADSGSGALTAFVAVVMALLAIVATYVYQGMVIRVVQNHGDGTQHSLGDLYESVKPVLVPLIFTSILAGIFLFIGFIAFVIPGLILLAHFAVIAPIVVIERVNYMEAIKRSWALCKGNAWTVFFVVIVLAIVLAICQGILVAIGTGVGQEVGNALGRFVAQMLLAPFPAIAGTVMYLMLSGATSPATAGSAPATGLQGGMPGAAGASASAPPPPPGK